MKAVLWTFAAIGGFMATAAFASEGEGSGRASAPTEPEWEFGVTAYPTSVRNGEDYTSATAVADRGKQHVADDGAHPLLRHDVVANPRDWKPRPGSARRTVLILPHFARTSPSGFAH